MKKDKEKVFDEVWNDERIAQFLDVIPPVGVDRDYHQIIKAYQSMRLNDFETFVDMMKADGRNLSAEHNGVSASAIMGQHKHGSDYAKVLAG